MVDDFGITNVYGRGDAVVFQQYMWRFIGKAWRLENGHTYEQVQTIGIYPSEDTGWNRFRDVSQGEGNV